MVVLTLKNLLQQTFTVDIELSSTVRNLKEKIEKENGSEYPAEGQKLIYAGKILQDDLSLESYNIDSKKFLVIMVTKPKAPPPSSAPTDPTAIAVEESSETTEKESSPTTTAASTTTTTTTTTTSESSTTSSSSTATSSTSTTTSSTSSPTTTPAAAVSAGAPESAESLIVMGDEFNKMVDNIMEMGYERTEVERALRASFNNPYTAVQYLVDGIPPNLDFASQSASSGGEGGAAPASEESEGGGGGGDSEENALSFLRALPQFVQMRQMIRSNPQLLDAFIHQIGQTNPNLLQVIQQNQEAFVRMLNEDNAGESAASGNSAGTGTLSSFAPSSGTPRSSSGGQETIVVSQEDRDAIERLKALGNFPEDVVIQAYFACEKNENLAAEFLFSQNWD